MSRRRTGPALFLLLAAAVATACISLDGLQGGAARDAAAPPPPPPSTEGGGDDDASLTDAGATRGEAYRSAIMADNPVSYWRFEETTGTVAADETGLHVGSYRLSPTLGVPGLFGSQGGAVELPGASNAHVEVPGPALAFAGVVPYTVELWVLPGRFVDFQWLAGTETFPPRSGWSIFANAVGEVFYEVWHPADGGSTIVRSLSSNRNLVLGSFQHVVVTYNGDIMKVYLDGELAHALPSPRAAPEASTLRLGCRLRDAGVLENCADDWRLDEVAIYDYPLTDARVLAHYELGRP